MARLTFRQGRIKRSTVERNKILCRHARSQMDQLAGFQHGMHHANPLSRNCYISSLNPNHRRSWSPLGRKELCMELRLRMTTPLRIGARVNGARRVGIYVRFNRLQSLAVAYIWIAAHS